MRGLVLLLLVAAVVWALMRSLREQRQARLARLGLVGIWDARSDAGEHQLILSGEPGGGDFEEISSLASGRHRQTGRWRMSGDALLFTDQRGRVSECELRLFDHDRMGLHGPGRERRIYERRQGGAPPPPRLTRG